MVDEVYFDVNSSFSALLYAFYVLKVFQTAHLQ